MKNKGIKISGRGTTTTTSGTCSAAIAIPNDAAGTRARFVYVAADTVAAIAFGLTGMGAATADDTMVTNEPNVFDVAGWTHYRVIQVTAGAKVNVSPVER